MLQTSIGESTKFHVTSGTVGAERVSGGPRQIDMDRRKPQFMRPTLSKMRDVHSPGRADADRERYRDDRDRDLFQDLDRDLGRTPARPALSSTSGMYQYSGRVFTMGKPRAISSP